MKNMVHLPLYKYKDNRVLLKKVELVKPSRSDCAQMCAGKRGLHDQGN
nr:MAG TPA: hypothetical protein [Bacteriophage sp.]